MVLFLFNSVNRRNLSKRRNERYHLRFRWFNHDKLRLVWNVGCLKTFHIHFRRTVKAKGIHATRPTAKHEDKNMSQEANCVAISHYAYGELKVGQFLKANSLSFQHMFSFLFY